MRALIINNEIREEIKKVIAVAKENVFVITTTPAYTGPLEEQSIVIPMGYWITYTEEKQPQGIWRHLSVSVDGDPKNMPSIPSVEMLMKEFGFLQSIDSEECIVNIFKCGEIREAVNVWEEIK